MLVCLASVKGSPGSTSTALTLAAVWPRPVVVVEADPSGGDLAYRCRAPQGGPLQPGKGLLTLAAAVRTGTPDSRAVRAHAQRLACKVDVVQGVTSTGQARGLGGLWSALAVACRISDVDVLVDVGRLDRTSPALPLAQAADVVLPVATASLASLMHLSQGMSELLPALIQQRDLSVRPVLVGPDAHAQQDCADLDELLARAGQPVQAAQSLSYDPRALVRLEDGEKGSGRLGRTLLLRRARAIADELLGPEDTRPALDGKTDDAAGPVDAESTQRPGVPTRLGKSLRAARAGGRR